MKVLIFSPFSYWKIHTAYDVLVSKSLALRGAEILHITCDKDIEFCDIHDRSLPDQEICSACTDLRQSLFVMLKTNHTFLGGFIEPQWRIDAKKWVETLKDEELENAEIEGRPVGNWVSSSIFTNFRVNQVYTDDPAIMKRYREYLETAYLVYFAMSKVLDEFKPDSMFIFNGRMFMTRIPLELAKERKIETLVHDRGYRKSTIQVKENETIIGIETPGRIWNRWKNIPLKESEFDLAKKYILDREAGKNIAWFSWVKEKSDYVDLIKNLGLDPSKKSVAIFTSSDDEMAAFKDWSNIFDSQKEWLSRSIEYFAKRTDLNLIIRIHPNTVANAGRIRSDERFMDFLNELAKDAPENVKFVMPDANINSYQIMDIASHVMVFFSSVSIESAARYTPVLLCGGGPFKDLELLHTLESKDNYFRHLAEFLESEPNFEQVKYAYRFAYYYFVKPSREIKYITHTDPFTPKFTFNKFQELLPGKDEELDKICDKIMYGKELIDLNPAIPSIFDEHKELRKINEIILERLSIDNEVKAVLDSIVNENSLLIFSVIIPTYDRIEILIKCLDALTNQTLAKSEFEVIIVDDGSPISPENDLTGYYEKLNLHFYWQENRGPAAARNLGIKNARGKFLLILNDDSIAAPDLLEVHYKRQMENESNKLAVIGSFDFIEEEMNKLFVNMVSNSSNVFLYSSMKRGMFYSFKYFWTCNISILRQGVIDAGMFDENFPDPMAEDIELGLRLERMGFVVYYEPDAICRHHHTMDVDTFVRRQIMWGKNLVRLLKKYPLQENLELLLFGINKFDETTYQSLTDILSNLRETSEKIYRYFKKLENVIINDNFKIIINDKMLNWEEALPHLLLMLQPLNNFLIHKGIIEYWDLSYPDDRSKFNINFDNVFQINLPDYKKIGLGDNLQLIKKTNEAAPAADLDFIFSVIIPTYNRKETLIRCLDALNDQTFNFNKFEVIVIDDGGTDGTEEISETKNFNFKFAYLRQPNSGPAAARNLGIKSANGKYILILNDDTIASANLLEKHLETHEKLNNPKAAVLGTFDYVPEAKIKPFVHFLSVSPMVFAYPIMKSGNYYNYRFFWTCNISISKTALLEVGLFDEDFREPMVEDTELGYRLEKHGFAVYYTEEARSMHDHSLTPDGFARRQRMSGRNVVKLFQKHPELLFKEQKLFGFSNLDEKTKIAFIKYINENEIIANENLEFLKEVNKIDIFNPGFIPITPDKMVRSEELVNIIESKIWVVHLVNFYKGILEALDPVSKAVKVNYETETILKPRILFTMFGWNESGGGTLFPRETALAIAGRGYEIGVFYSGMKHPKTSNPYYFENSEDGGVKLFGVFNKQSDFLLLDSPETEICDNRVIHHFESVLNDFKPDIVHFQNFLGLSFEMASIIKKRGIPSVFTPHNYHFIDPALYMISSTLEIWKNSDFFQNSDLLKRFPEKARYYEKRRDAALDTLNNKIDNILAISSRQREIFIDFGVNPEKINIVHQIPQIPKHFIKAKQESDKIVFGFLGSVIPHKGVHKIIEASNLIKGDDYEILIYGDGNALYLNELKKLDRKAKVKFMGSYTKSDLPDIFSEIDISIVPSIWEEAAGLVLLESLAFSTPVIAARIGGIPDFIKENESGLFYPYYSSSNLSACMSEIIRNKNLIKKMKLEIKSEKSFDDYLNYLLNVYNNKLSLSKSQIDNFLI